MSRLEIVEVTSGIWSVRRGRSGSASYLLKTNPGGILIDAGSDPTGADVMQCLQSARVGLRSIRAILLTHSHPHAASGARALRERSGAPLLSSSEEAEALARGGDGDERRVLLPGLPWLPWRGRRNQPPLRPDGHLTDGDRVESFVRAVATPGHSNGHLAFWFEPMRVLFTGDALSVVNGAPEISPGTSGREREEASQSMRKCLALEPEILLPAHGLPLLFSGRREN